MTVKFSKNLVIWEGVTIANAYLYSESFHHHIFLSQTNGCIYSCQRAVLH